jgi:hypothetical protein
VALAIRFCLWLFVALPSIFGPFVGWGLFDLGYSTLRRSDAFLRWGICRGGAVTPSLIVNHLIEVSSICWRTALEAPPCCCYLFLSLSARCVHAVAAVGVMTCSWPVQMEFSTWLRASCELNWNDIWMLFMSNPCDTQCRTKICISIL